MKAMIQIQTNLFHNNKFDLLSENILELKICEKEIFSYYFDLFNELKVEEIYITNEVLKQYINEYYLSDVYAPKITFIKEENISIESDFLIIKNIGFIFDSYNQIKKLFLDKKNNFTIKDKTFELSYINKNSKELSKSKSSNLLDIKALENLNDYVSISNTILSRLDNIDYILGYSNNNGISFGKNVQIDESCTLIEPLIILDNVKISKGCVLGPNTIIGNDIYIDENTNISNSIIYNNSFISSNLIIKDKITLVNQLIDTKDFTSHTIDNLFIN
jgi:NDP-sugar pyrophosphorylase family protein